MSYDYYLKIDTEKSPLEILTILLAVDGFQRVKGDEALGAPGLRVVARRMDDRYDVEFVEERFGFAPKVTVVFSHTTQGLDHRSVDDMGAAVTALLNAADGDAVLYSQDPTLVLQRRDGQTTLNSNSADYERFHSLAPDYGTRAFEEM